jgi:cell division GTPase FtsZ
VHYAGIAAGLQGVDFIVANTDAQALTMSKAKRIIQMGAQVTEGLGAGSLPEVGRAAAEEAINANPRSIDRLTHGVRYCWHGRRYWHRGSAHYRQDRA